MKKKKHKIKGKWFKSDKCGFLVDLFTLFIIFDKKLFHIRYESPSGGPKKKLF